MLSTIGALWFICSVVVFGFFMMNDGTEEITIGRSIVRYMGQMLFTSLGPLSLGFILSDILDTCQEK